MKIDLKQLRAHMEQSGESRPKRRRSASARPKRRSMQELRQLYPKVAGMTFCFTGKFKSGITRAQAAKRVKLAGGKTVNHIAKGLDYLVTGADGSDLYGDNSKRVRVERLRTEGNPIQVLSERRFLSMTKGTEQDDNEG